MIIVTSGHIDHGKTALLEALTGTHTAHLPEEKKRGMTIDLGYAYLPFANQILGFIDVPGHEKFLANMLAGLGGIHYAMLIIACDEGIAAQTREHLAILRQLQLDKILIVLTKADRANTEQITQLQQNLFQQYPFLAENPIFITSAKTLQGIEQLRNYLAELVNLADSDKSFRYAIDRIFSVKGAGTVVTGTAFSGQVKINDELFLSNGEKVRVKNIHAQNQPTQQGQAGQRLAINIHTDLERNLIARGDWLFSQPPQLACERVIVQVNAEINLVESQSIHLYHAADRCLATLSLLFSKNLMPQQSALAEIILKKPLFLAFGDKLILRSGDNKKLIAGAKVLEINAPKRYKRSQARLAFLTQLQQATDNVQRVNLYLQYKTVTRQSLLWLEQLTEAQLDQIFQQNNIQSFQQWCFSQDYVKQKTQQILTALADYHQQHNDQLGLGKARLYRIAALNQPESLIYHFIDQLLKQGLLQQHRGWLHLPEHKIQFSPVEQQLWQQVCTLFEQQNRQPLWVRNIAMQLQQPEEVMRHFLYKAGKMGYLTAIVRDRFFLTDSIYDYAKLVKKLIEQQGSISVNQLRDELQFGRKLTVQLIEYFDSCGFLRRKGNIHILRDEKIFD